MQHNHTVRRAARRNYMPADTRPPPRGLATQGIRNDPCCRRYYRIELDRRIQCFRRVVRWAILDLKPFYPSGRVPLGLSPTLDPLFVTHPAGIRAQHQCGVAKAVVAAVVGHGSCSSC